ncbi:lytic transglycosylase domain-containing protein [Sulfurimonas sp.]|uniref:lytic transglycosylase domain-containing protein n=1 Tax=Sulfurimonas sp. TaxID=2022749 RepID=UPI00260625EF|nr:lytic transglycosylase domain-containing protein [Sulfurimonas sp.]MCW8895169.1 lytic transglycosylase domain-containing protein [Sulfurimonas sp.]MCW9067752.1 lytic transglycosylase domain-containing protein [Sulfurimonas sp.]
MIKYLLISSLLFVSGYAKISLEDINSKPPCRAKDFMIWQFLKQNITPDEADKAYEQVYNNKNNRLFYAYAKKTKNKHVKYKLSCKKEQNLLSIKDQECLELAFTPYKATKLSNAQREKLAKRLKSESKINILKILNENHSKNAYKTYDADTILTLLTNTGYKYRSKHLNIEFDKEFIDSLAESRKISYFIKTMVNNDKFNKLQKSLLKMSGKSLNSQATFYLALNHLRHSDEASAVKFFKLSASKAKYQKNIDKNNFWIYFITKEQEYLDKLLKSKDINIYSLYAHDKMDKRVDNYFTGLQTNKNTSNKNLLDPFHWNEILKEIKTTQTDDLFDLAQEYKQKDMLPVRSLIIQKAYKYNIHGYVMPYDEHLEDLSLDDRALVYAIMRQESNMIPSALSHSYALGLMQIMPFVTDHISKTIDEPITRYDDMFIPKNNIRYSKAHLKWMKKSLYHPLFIAYAYNGGLGFLKKFLRKDKFKEGKYEPFLSMEMMTNAESREYGKKVLANYVMYKEVLGEKVSILDLFDTLTQPKKTDRFRKRG